MKKNEEFTVLVGGLSFMVQEYVDIIQKQFPGLNVIAYPVLQEEDGTQVPSGIEKVDIVASFNSYPYAVPRIENLKWFHILMTGYEHILATRLISSDVLLTTSAGSVSIPVAEVVMGYLLFFVKKLRASIENQKIHKMDRMLGQMRELHGRNLAVLGLGHLGKEVAKKAKLGFEMHVLGVDSVVSQFEYADQVVKPEDLDQVLKESDFVVITLPLTSQTEGMISTKQLQGMKPTAYLINVARGEILDKKAFTLALKENWIAGAAIDVFWGDPTKEAVLDKHDALWDLKNLLITAHNATGTDRYIERTAQVFCENLKRFMAGEPLVNIVNQR